MEVRVPGGAAALVGAASQVFRGTRERVSTFLACGEPVGEPTREPCPICGIKIDARAVSASGITWSRLVTHMVTAHDAWWPQLDDLCAQVCGRTAPSAAEPTRVDPSDWEAMDPDLPPPGRLPARSQPASRPRHVTAHRESSWSARVTGGGSAGDSGTTQRSGSLAMLEADAVATIASTYGIDAELAAGIVRVSRAVGAHPFDLANLISFESAGTFSPGVRGPRSTGATGLIQFTEATARWLGTTTAELAKLDAAQQMPWVQAYLEKVGRGRPLDTAHKLSMAVFYPKAIDWPPNQEFPAEVTRRNTHRLADGSPFPIRTPADYLTLASERARLPSGDEAGPISPDREPSVIDGILNWWTGVFGPAPDVAASPDPTWDLSPGVSATLRGPDGRSWHPGAVPAGTYRLVPADLQPSEPVQLVPGGRYRASSIGRLFRVG